MSRGPHFTLDDLPPALRAEAERQLAPSALSLALQARSAQGVPVATPKPPKPRKPKGKALPAYAKDSLGSPLPNSLPQPDQKTALGAPVQGKAEGFQRTLVRFVGYRVRPLDPDNFAGSVKDLLDGLRHAGLLSGDEPWRIRLETEQVKVGTYAEERTEIEIDTGHTAVLDCVR